MTTKPNLAGNTGENATAEGGDADFAPLREAIALAELARTCGDMPFGAVLVGAGGKVLARAANTIVTDRDMTAHAEMNALRIASRTCTPQEVAGATMYASGEPCPMCSGAMIRLGVRRVVFGIRAAIATPYLPTTAGVMAHGVECRAILALAPSPVEVRGPVLEDEARAPFEAFARNGKGGKG